MTSLSQSLLDSHAGLNKIAIDVCVYPPTNQCPLVSPQVGVAMCVFMCLCMHVECLYIHSQ